jgi:hypothetical protein
VGGKDARTGGVVGDGETIGGDASPVTKDGCVGVDGIVDGCVSCPPGAAGENVSGSVSTGVDVVVLLVLSPTERFVDTASRLSISRSVSLDRGTCPAISASRCPYGDKPNST